MMGAEDLSASHNIRAPCCVQQCVETRENVGPCDWGIKLWALKMTPFLDPEGQTLDNIELLYYYTEF